ncbi:MAG: 4'-phosphopantetheinyl transferase superfamily protein [Flavobacteriales bacterium]
MPKSVLTFHPSVHLWEITESFENLCEITILTEEERDIVDSFRKVTRKKEILASRALLQSVIPDGHIHYVNKNPQLTDLKKEISISHTDNKVMIQIKEGGELCGVDIQEVSDKATRVKTKFLSPKEMEMVEFHNLNSLSLTNLLWSAKETAYKAFASVCEQEEVIEFKSQLLTDEINEEKRQITGHFVERNKRTPFVIGFSIQKDYVVTWFEK